MASIASQLYYEAHGLQRRADGGVDPPKWSAALIAKLADELERLDAACGHFDRDLMTCEQFYRLCDRLNEIEIEYGRAVDARDLAVRVKAENRKTPPRASDAFKLRDAKYDAQIQLDLIEECRPEFATRRELLDANAAAVLAAELYEIAETKFQDAERFERRTGIRKHPRSRVRLVTDGYVTTGKYKMIDGARVAVLEKVQ